MNQGPEPERVRAAAVAAVSAFVADAGVDAEELGDGRWFLRLAGERKLGIGVHLAVGDRTLRVESFFMRAPEEQRERLASGGRRDFCAPRRFSGKAEMSTTCIAGSSSGTVGPTPATVVRCMTRRYFVPSHGRPRCSMQRLSHMTRSPTVHRWL